MGILDNELHGQEEKVGKPNACHILTESILSKNVNRRMFFYKTSRKYYT